MTRVLLLSFVTTVWLALNSLFCADVPLSNYSLTHYCLDTVVIATINIIQATIKMFIMTMMIQSNRQYNMPRLSLSRYAGHVTLFS